jgi:hypothetical protein
MMVAQSDVSSSCVAFIAINELFAADACSVILFSDDGLTRETTAVFD